MQVIGGSCWVSDSSCCIHLTDSTVKVLEEKKRRREAREEGKGFWSAYGTVLLGSEARRNNDPPEMHLHRGFFDGTLAP